MHSSYITYSPFLDRICGFHTRIDRRDHAARSRCTKAQRSAAVKDTDMNRKHNYEPVSLLCLENKYKEYFVQYCIYKVYYKLQVPRDITLDRLIMSHWRIQEFATAPL